MPWASGMGPKHPHRDRFAIGVAVGTIRIWIGIFVAAGLLDFHDSFAAAFWIAFILHALAAEWWVRTTPRKTG
jgi:hypothetical protein